MEFGVNYFQCRISSTERINCISLEACHFGRIYSVCKNLFANFRGISLEEVDRDYEIDVVEEWSPNEDLFTITIEPVSVGLFVHNMIGEHVENTWGFQEQGNIGFPLGRVYMEDEEYVSRNAG